MRKLLPVVLLFTAVNTWGQCPDAVIPQGCRNLLDFAGGSAQDATRDLRVDACVRVPAGTYTFRFVNVVNGGQLYFADPNTAQTTTFQAKSILVEKGGKLQAGASCQPFGQNGGKLVIGLWGNDPTRQNQNPTPDVSIPENQAISCQGGLGSTGCFDDSRVNKICEVAPGGDLTDPCNATRPADSSKDNARFEGYGPMMTDPNLFGYKVLAVSYGGSLKLFGKKGVNPADFLDPKQPMASCPVPPAAQSQTDVQAWANLSGNSWALLNSTAAGSQNKLTLDRAVDWAKDDQIVVATTDWSVGHSELAKVASNQSGALELQSNLTYPHYGQTLKVQSGTSGNPNTEVDLRGAVGLLSRSITIQSLGKTAADDFPLASVCGAGANNPDCYFGGHVVARQGFAEFQLQGVELHQLGQGGRMGHYPVHFHMAKATNYNPFPADMKTPKPPLGNAFVKDSSIWESNTRFITLHATHDVALARNVGYLSVGHAFYLEDGTEINNLVCQNLGVSARPSYQQYFTAQTAGPTQRFIPPILEKVSLHKEPLSAKDIADEAKVPYRGGDSLFPSMFWIMNAYNEFVGNKAVGVGGFGPCYWLFSPYVSGSSTGLNWSRASSTQQTHSPQDYANFQPGGRQPPLKRFRGNSCSTAAYGLTTQLDFQAVDGNVTSRATPVPNPYQISRDMLPIAQSNFNPMNFVPSGDGDPTCAPSDHEVENSAGCSTTVIDRFTTSFNWSEANFGSVWLRPGNFLFLNSAITDQLYGGLVFVTGGSPEQALPRNLMIAKNSVFAGTSRDKADPNASPLGPRFDPAQCDGQYCSFPQDGTVLYIGAFQPKRLISIYDGPFFGDGNVFQNVESFTCDPWDGTGSGCGVYKTTHEPLCGATGNPKGADATCVQSPVGNPPECGNNPDRPRMLVIDAAIGWKQPNGFYYPPAFSFRNSHFAAKSERHNVFDQYRFYVQGVDPKGRNVCALLSAPPPPPPSPPAPVPPSFGGLTPIDFSTILNDLDGTLNGVLPDLPTMNGSSKRSNGLSRNFFYGAPNQIPECSSFGTDTSANEFVSSLMAKLKGFPSPENVVDDKWMGTQPLVPIYRQFKLPGAADACSSSPSICSGRKLGCPRGSFMLGASNGQAPALTTNHGVYYIDTSSTEGTDCITRSAYQLSSFVPKQTYMIYQLYATTATQVTYQFYVGPQFNPTDKSVGNWVRVRAHEGNLNMKVSASPIPLGMIRYGAKDGLPDGILEVTLDNSTVASDFQFSTLNSAVQCQPRDICQPGGNNKCVLNPAFSEPGITGPVGEVCEFWATRTTGQAEDGVFLSDCPANGCVGFAFTIPDGFTATTGYQAAGGSSAPLLQDFPNKAPWNVKLRDHGCFAPTLLNFR